MDGTSYAPRPRDASDASRERAFRDPPSRQEEADALTLDLAGVLVGARALPIELPRFGLRLLTVRASSARAIELWVGHADPIAALRIAPRRASVVGVAAAGPSDARLADVEVSLRELHPSHAHDRRALEAMIARLRRTLTAPRWERALELARELRALPSSVPLEHYRQRVEGAPGVGLVRVGFGCNQDCGLCWQDREWPRYPAEQVLTWISDLRAQGAHELIVSGGEPTLDAALLRYVEHARAIGFSAITLETNAIQCAKAGVAETLARAGVTSAFVSLHSADAAVSDRITRAPGTHARTVTGIHALVLARVRVKVNAVMTAEGLDALPTLPDYLRGELARHGEPIRLMLSYPSDAFDPALTASIRPDPDALRRALRATIDRCVALGVEVDGLDGPCGPPLCAHGADRRVVQLQTIREPISFRCFVPACDDCAVRPACPGVRSGDLDAFGARCVEPLARWPESAG